VVGPENVDDEVESALELVDVVGDVRQAVRPQWIQKRDVPEALCARAGRPVALVGLP